MIKPIVSIIVALLFIAGCAYRRISEGDCLCISDLTKEPSSIVEMSFSIDEFIKKTIRDSNLVVLKVTIDHDKNEYNYYAKDTLPNSFYRLNRDQRKNFYYKYHVYDLGGYNASGWKKIKQLEFLEKKQPFSIDSIVSGGWGGKRLYLSCHDSGLVHMKIKTEIDTFVVPIFISKDTIYSEPQCKRIQKTKKVFYFNLDAWVVLPFQIIKRKLTKPKTSQ
jgi:hypothetical protein